MLKIKDNVDLTTLETYGFKKQYNRDTGELYLYQHRNYELMRVYTNTRLLNVSYTIHTDANFVNDVLYNLISNNLIEKINPVENDNVIIINN